MIEIFNPQFATRQYVKELTKFSPLYFPKWLLECDLECDCLHGDDWVSKEYIPIPIDNNTRKYNLYRLKFGFPQTIMLETYLPNLPRNFATPFHCEQVYIEDEFAVAEYVSCSISTLGRVSGKYTFSLRNNFNGHLSFSIYIPEDMPGFPGKLPLTT